MDSSEVREKALALPDQAKAIRIVDAPSYTAAADFLKGVKALRAEVAAAFDPIVKAAHDAHKTAIAQKKAADTPLDDAERIVKGEMVLWDDEQERIRREEERRLQEEARKLEEERLLLEAETLAANGQKAEADALLSEPILAPVIQFAKATPKVEGVSYAEVWQFEISNLALIPREYMVPDTVKIRGVVRAMKGAANIPGIRVFSKRQVRSGR